MPLSQQKIIRIIFDECKTIEERCVGYKEELIDVIAEIIALERQHRLQGMYIQQKINDKCNAAGYFLSKNRT